MIKIAVLKKAHQILTAPNVLMKPTTIQQNTKQQNTALYPYERQKASSIKRPMNTSARENYAPEGT